jgi:hypothetical protein
MSNFFFGGNLVPLQLLVEAVDEACRQRRGDDRVHWGQTVIHFPFYNYSEGASQVGISITRKFDAPIKIIASHPFPLHAFHQEGAHIPVRLPLYEQP